MDDTEGVGVQPEYIEFLKVKKNQIAVLSNLVQQKARWEDLTERYRLLAVLRQCLHELHDHKSNQVRELSRLAPKMKNFDMDLKKFLILFLPIERKYSRGVQDDQILITSEDKGEQKVERIPLYVILDSLRSAFNVDCIGVSHLYLCGYTATPDQNDSIKKTTMGAEKGLSWSSHEDIMEVIKELKAKEIPIFALETVEDSKVVFTPGLFPPTGCALILGNERFGIEAHILKECTNIVSIPCNGVKNSLNVGVAFGICGYEVLRQWKFSGI